MSDRLIFSGYDEEASAVGFWLPFSFVHKNETDSLLDVRRDERRNALVCYYGPQAEHSRHCEKSSHGRSPFLCRRLSWRASLINPQKPNIYSVEFFDIRYFGFSF